jgi:hypothetical protein
MNVRPVGTHIFHAGGQTDGQAVTHDERNSWFSQFRERASFLHRSEFQVLTHTVVL